MEARDLYTRIWRRLAAEKSMILLAGPRQTGKTTLAQIISRSFTNSLYFNWDIAQHRSRLITDPLFFEEVERRDSSTPLIVLDEIHKYKDWKNYLKGVYDQFHDRYQFLVSGSGRLDIHQKGGDSLAGRYYLFHLWPFTIAELGKRNRTVEDFLDDPLRLDMEGSQELAELWSRLAEHGGFPEPFLAQRLTTYRRWSNTYSRQLIREDIRDLAGVKSVEDMETLYLLLPSKVGSPLSIASLAGDLRVSYNSVRSWLAIFERFFLAFSLSPWTSQIARAIQKERKLYLWDAPRIDEPAARFENMVAMELWRAVTAWTDLGHGSFSLHFVRNRNKQEVDFLIAEGNRPLLLVETKLSDTTPSKTLRKFQRALGVPAVQLVGEGGGFQLLSNEEHAILVAPAHQWLSRLP